MRTITTLAAAIALTLTATSAIAENTQHKDWFYDVDGSVATTVSTNSGFSLFHYVTDNNTGVIHIASKFKSCDELDPIVVLSVSFDEGKPQPIQFDFTCMDNGAKPPVGIFDPRTNEGYQYIHKGLVSSTTMTLHVNNGTTRTFSSVGYTGSMNVLGNIKSAL